MSLYCRGGATVCSMFDLPANVSRRRQITAAARGPGRASRLPQDRQAMVCQSSPPANGGTSGRNGELCKFAAVRDEDAAAVIRGWDRGQRRSNAGAPHRSCDRASPRTGRPAAAYSSRHHRRPGSVGAESVEAHRCRPSHVIAAVRERRRRSAVAKLEYSSTRDGGNSET